LIFAIFAYRYTLNSYSPPAFQEETDTVLLGNVRRGSPSPGRWR
jgi:hypothetical protein